MRNVNKPEVSRLAFDDAADRMLLIRQRDAMANHPRLFFALDMAVAARERSIIQLAALLIRPAFAS